MRHLDLFSGIGGFSLAARWVGWETVAQVEWDKWCQKVLAKNFPDALRFGDIKQFNDGIESFFTNGKCLGWTEGAGQNLQQQEQITKRQDIGNFCKEIRLRGRINIITGGFPCQPFPHAGKRQGVADERYLWPEMLRTIRILKPSFVVGENVAGLVSMDGGKTLDAILADMENEGYQVESFIIPACAIGAWHRRDRIWIVAYKSGEGLEGQFGEELQRGGVRFAYSHKDVSDSDNQRQQTGREYNITSRTEWITGSSYEGATQWQSEPSVGRVANGIPNRVDRLKGLGNAIVPQVAFELFKAIEQYNP